MVGYRKDLSTAELSTVVIVFDRMVGYCAATRSRFKV